MVQTTATMSKKFPMFDLYLLVFVGVLELVECCGRSGAGTGAGSSGSAGGSGAVWLPGELII